MSVSIEESIVRGSFGLSIGCGTIIGGFTQTIYSAASDTAYSFNPMRGWSYKTSGGEVMFQEGNVIRAINYDTLGAVIISFDFPKNLILSAPAKSMMTNFRNAHINAINIFYENGVIQHIQRDGNVFTDYHEGRQHTEGDFINNITIDVSKEFFVK